MGLRFCVDKPLLDARCDELLAKLLLIKVPATGAGVTRYLSIPESLVLTEPAQSTKAAAAAAVASIAPDEAAALTHVAALDEADMPTRSESGQPISLARAMSAQIGLPDGMRRARSGSVSGGGCEPEPPMIAGVSDLDAPLRCATEARRPPWP